MPRLRKNKPIELDDDQLYVVMHSLFMHTRLAHTSDSPNLTYKPEGYELQLCRDKYDIISTEFWARAKEEQRIDNELYELAKEYE